MRSSGRLTWEKHGDIRVMKANGWVRALIYYEGGWWCTGIFDAPGSTQLGFSRSLAVAKRDAVRAYRIWSQSSANTAARPDGAEEGK